MSTPSLARPTPRQSTASDVATWGPVHLKVTDPQRSLGFWRDLVGLSLLEADGAELRLGVDDAELLVLHPGAGQRQPRGHTGLYHLAIHLPSEAEFARVLARLFSARYPHAPTDHIMHWATYLDDPDGIGLELSFETLDRFGGYDLESPRFSALDAQGRRRDAVAPLDLEEVFGHLTDRDFTRPLPAETRIGHIHLHVAEIQPALDFYSAVGFTPGVNLPVGMADMTAGGTFPHRLALNVWQGVGAPPAPEDAAGLSHSVLRFGSPDELDAAIERVRAAGGETREGERGAMVHDPSGNRTYLTS